MPPLNRAVTLEQMDDIPGTIGEELHLDVLRLVDESLEEDGAVAESGQGFGLSALEGVLEC
ncbi:hypothetical protein BC938DRAFT_482100 [Jimgerdemannia flammicorona]|uniref:Uncharacterized protein n=1 Tax=Jimgerdemannia flammicorona TaxID=994334 RepID=A0A433QEP9_9FUNG|nr:hypothetical protein BC938DRAFT_482100 [Jimgerdemannia flammicorona]